MTLFQNLNPQAGMAVAVVVVILAILCITRGLWKDLLAIFSKVLQEIIRLFVTAFTFFLKICSTIELYIVLLIDIFSGNLKQKPVMRLLCVSIVTLSAASFYTTFTGLEYLIEAGPLGIFIRACITFGVQAILLGASLQIGNLSVVKWDGGGRPHNQPRLIVTLALVGLAALCFLLSCLDPFRGTATNVFYLLGCASVFVCLILMLPNIFSIQRNTQLKTKSTVLLVVYIVTLCCSSFFSFNSIFSTLYQPEQRRADDLNVIVRAATEMLQQTEVCFDKEYELQVQQLLFQTTQSLKDYLEKNSSTTLTPEERKIMGSAAFNDNYEQLSRITNEYLHLNPTVTRQMEIQDFLTRVLKPKIYADTGDIGGVSILEFEHIFQYQQARDQILGNIDLMLVNLQKSAWSSDEWDACRQAMEHISSYVNSYITLQDQQSITGDLPELGGLFDTAAAWKRYLDTAKTLNQEILDFGAVSNPDWDTTAASIMDKAKGILSVVPLYFQTFQYAQSDGIFTIVPEKSVNTEIAGLSLNFQREVRNHSADLNQIEQNLRAFVGNPLLGLFSLLIALLIDTLILFVGMLIPRSIQYFIHTPAYGRGTPNANAPGYTPDELEEMLGNLFNKPARDTDDD